MFGGYDGVQRMNDFFEFRLGTVSRVLLPCCPNCYCAAAGSQWCACEHFVSHRHIPVVSHSFSRKATQVRAVLALRCLLTTVVRLSTYL